MIENYATSQKFELDYFLHVAPKATVQRLANAPFVLQFALSILKNTLSPRNLNSNTFATWRKKATEKRLAFYPFII